MLMMIKNKIAQLEHCFRIFFHCYCYILCEMLNTVCSVSLTIFKQKARTKRKLLETCGQTILLGVETNNIIVIMMRRTKRLRKFKKATSADDVIVEISNKATTDYFCSSEVIRFKVDSNFSSDLKNLNVSSYPMKEMCYDKEANYYYS